MIGAILRRAALLALVWWALSQGRPDAWVLGTLIVAAAVWASLRLQPPSSNRIRVAGVLRFAIFFMWHSVKGGLQVAFLALRTPRDLRPTVLELRLGLPAGAPRVLMTNALSLMPGTLGVRLEDERLQVHVLDDRMPAAAAARALEARIAGMLGARR